MNFEKHHNWFLGHFWSLSVEEQFYIFWPLMLFFFKKNLKPILYILVIYSAISRVIAYKLPQLENLSLAPFFSYSDAIFIGSFGGIFFFEKKINQHTKLFNNLYLQLLALLVIVSVILLTKNLKGGFLLLPFGNSITAVAILYLILSYITPSQNAVYKFLNNKVVMHIGVLSYSMYIWQQFFFVGNFIFVWRDFPYNLLCIYTVSLCSYYLWEKQFLNLRKRITNS